MPTPNYKTGLIYMLRHKDDNELENIYVGSTTNFKGRKASHKGRCNNPNNEKHHYKIYQYIRENDGWENWVMKPIENYPCNTLTELLAREDVVMLEYANRLNEKRASRKQKEYRKDNKEHIQELHKKYRDDNKEVLEEYHKEYRKKNGEKNKEYSKEWFKNNKEKIKKYYEENAEQRKEKRKEQITCECGCISTKGSLKRHQLSKKHLDLMLKNRR